MQLDYEYSLYKQSPELHKEEFGIQLLHYVTKTAQKKAGGHPKEDIEDIVSISLVEVFKNINAFTGESKFSTWVGSIVRNVISDFYKAQARYPEEEIKDQQDYGETVAQSDRNILLKQVLNKLEGDDKLLITLEIAGYSDEEIATRMGLTLGQLRMKLHRLRLKLKDFYK